jgi:hypothetical protein
MQEADEAAARPDWPRAVQRIREALKSAGKKAPPEWKQMLGVCLSNMAVAKLDRAVEMVNAIAAQGVAIGTDFPHEAALALLEEARKELGEAARCDPSNDVSQKNLAQVQTFLADLVAARESFNRAASPGPVRTAWPPFTSDVSDSLQTPNFGATRTPADDPGVRPFSVTVMRAVQQSNAAIDRSDWAGAAAALRVALAAFGHPEPTEWRRSLSVCLVNGAAEKANRAIALVNESPWEASRAIAMLEESTRELQEAEGCDPTNVTIRQHLENVRGALGQLTFHHRPRQSPKRPVLSSPESLLWRWPLNDSNFWGGVGLFIAALAAYCV